MQKLNPQELEVITKMNELYFGKGGRPKNIDYEKQAPIAANYFLKLIEGAYTDTESQIEKKIKADAPKELVIEKALCAFLDFTSQGNCFLYHNEEYIPQNVKNKIASTLVDKIEKTVYTNRTCASRAISILTDMKMEIVLPSAKGSWLEDHYEPPRIEFDPLITNQKLIPEAIKYARENCPLLK